MNRRAAALALVVLFSVYACESKNDCHPNAAEIRSQLSKDLPLGSSRAAVKEYLSKHDIPLGDYLPADRVYGVTRCVNHWWEFATMVRRDFTFDSQGRLSEIGVDIWVDGI
jgi:hypothetical protein